MAKPGFKGRGENFQGVPVVCIYVGYPRRLLTLRRLNFNRVRSLHVTAVNAKHKLTFCSYVIISGAFLGAAIHTLKFY